MESLMQIGNLWSMIHVALTKRIAEDCLVQKQMSPPKFWKGFSHAMEPLTKQDLFDLELSQLTYRNISLRM
jgi:hypothetical protein